jgi:hypothetical protein
MYFKLTDIHVKRIPQSVKQFGHVYVHGDGQFYVDRVITQSNGFSHIESKSKQHAEFHTSAPGDHRHEYVRRYDDGDKLPTSVDELTRDLIAAKAKSDLKASMPETAKSLNILTEQAEEVEIVDGENQPAKRGPKPKI